MDITFWVVIDLEHGRTGFREHDARYVAEGFPHAELRQYCARLETCELIRIK